MQTTQTYRWLLACFASLTLLVSTAVAHGVAEGFIVIGYQMTGYFVH